MGKILFFSRLQENVRASIVYLVFVLMIASLTFACATGYKKQATSNANITAKAPAKTESKNGKTNADQQIVCRNIEVTGSRFPRKVCATKAQWTAIDTQNTRKVQQFERDFDRQTGIYTAPGTDAFGGQTTGAAAH